MGAPAIELQAVDKSFRKNRVLRGTTFQVEAGCTFAFLGRNGAGKTTAIRMLMGLLSRVVSQLNVLEIGFSVRVSIGLISMALFAPLLEPSLEGLNEQFLVMLERALDALEV